MRKFFNYALVLLIAAAMLFSFTSCDDDDDDDGLSEKQIVNVAAAALGGAVTSGSTGTPSIGTASDTTYAYDITIPMSDGYSTWIATTNSSYNIRVLTIDTTADYSCSVNGSYEVADSGKYSVTISSGANISVDFTDYSFSANITATINDEGFILVISGDISNSSPVSSITINGNSGSTTTANSAVSGLVETIQSQVETLQTTLTAYLSALSSSSAS